MIFVGWDPAALGFYVLLVDLCQHCGGWGEDPETDTFCVACQSEGVNWSAQTDSKTGLTLNELESTLSAHDIALPVYVRADLESDQRANAAALMYDYDLDPRHT